MGERQRYSEGSPPKEDMTPARLMAIVYVHDVLHPPGLPVSPSTPPSELSPFMAYYTAMGLQPYVRGGDAFSSTDVSCERAEGQLALALLGKLSLLGITERDLEQALFISTRDSIQKRIYIQPDEARILSRVYAHFLGDKKVEYLDIARELFGSENARRMRSLFYAKKETGLRKLLRIIRPNSTYSGVSIKTNTGRRMLREVLCQQMNLLLPSVLSGNDSPWTSSKSGVLVEA